MFNRARLYTRNFLLRLVTVVIGIVTTGLVAASYDKIFTEEPFLSVVCISVIISILGMISYTFDLCSNSVVKRGLEIFFHFSIALALFMTGSVFLFSVVGRRCTGNCTSIMTKRYLAALLGLANAFIYGFSGWALLEVKIVCVKPVPESTQET